MHYNGAEVLKNCLESLRRLTYPRFEVVVVDNASTDASAEVLARYPSVRVVHSGHNRGFAGETILACRPAADNLFCCSITTPSSRLTFFSPWSNIFVTARKLVLCKAR